MSFEDEAFEAFEEVATTTTGTPFYLTNDRHTGTISRSMGEAPYVEAGAESIGGITIACPVGQFELAPDATRREQVAVESGPFAGKYTLATVQVDAAHYYLTCRPLE